MSFNSLMKFQYDSVRFFNELKILAKNMFFVSLIVNLCFYALFSQNFLRCDSWLSAGLVRMNACTHRGARL